MAHGHIGQQCRRIPVTPGWKQAAGLLQFCALADTALDQGLDLLQLHSGIDRANIGVLVKRIADTQGLNAVAQFAKHRTVNAFLDEEARARTTDVTLVEKDCADDSFHSLVDWSVLENNIRGLAAQFERELLVRAREGLCDLLAYLGAVRESDFIDARMLNDGRTCCTRTRDNVDNSRREICFLEYLCQAQSGNAGGFRWLQHHRAAAGKGRRDLPCRHEQREIPWNNLTGDSGRFGSATGKGILELVSPARVIKKMRCHQRQIDIA